MQRREFLVSATVAGSLALLSGCKQNKSPAATAKTKVRVAQWGQEKYLIYLPFYIAQARGLFSDSGLDVELTYSGNDDQVFASVLRGDAQFGIGDPIFAAISHNRGADGVVVGQIVDKVALWGISKAGSRRMESPADFAHTRIGTFPRPSTTYTLVKDMIDRNRVPGAKIIEVPIGSEVALLENGGADVVMVLEPAASTAVKAGYEIVTSFPRLWGSFAFTGLSSVASYCESNPQVVVALKKAMQDALSFAHSSPGETVSIAQSLFASVDKDIIENAVKRMLSDETIPKNFAVSPQGWSSAVKVRQEMKELAAGDYNNVIV